MKRSIVVVPALLLVGVLGAACSSSSSSGGSSPAPRTSTSSTASSTSSSSTSSSSTSDGGSSVPSTTVLQGIVVQQSDLPSGWTGKAAQAESAQDKQLDAQLDACVGASVSAEQDQVQQVQSDDFSKGQATVSSDASSYKSETDVTNQVAALKSPKAQSCLSSLFRKEIGASVPSGATLSDVTITLDTKHNGGIANLAGFANGSITLTAQGQTVKIYIGAAFFTGRQVTGNVSFTSIGTPLSTTFTNPIVEAVAKRAANA